MIGQFLAKTEENCGIVLQETWYFDWESPIILKYKNETLFTTEVAYKYE